MRIKTIAERAERELAAELLTRSSDKQRSLLPAALRGTSPTPCPQDKGIRGDKGDRFLHRLPAWAYWSCECVLFRLYRSPPPLHHHHRAEHKDMNAGCIEEERNTTGRTWSPVCVRASSIILVYFSEDVTFQPADLHGAPHSQHFCIRAGFHDHLSEEEWTQEDDLI